MGATLDPTRWERSVSLHRRLTSEGRWPRQGLFSMCFCRAISPICWEGPILQTVVVEQIVYLKGGGGEKQDSACFIVQYTTDHQHAIAAGPMYKRKIDSTLTSLHRQHTVFRANVLTLSFPFLNKGMLGNTNERFHFQKLRLCTCYETISHVHDQTTAPARYMAEWQRRVFSFRNLEHRREGEEWICSFHLPTNLSPSVYQPKQLLSLFLVNLNVVSLSSIFSIYIVHLVLLLLSSMSYKIWSSICRHSFMIWYWWGTSTFILLPRYPMLNSSLVF